jgi:hypothetical protein
MGLDRAMFFNRLLLARTTLGRLLNRSFARVFWLARRFMPRSRFRLLGLRRRSGWTNLDRLRRFRRFRGLRPGIQARDSK